MPDALLSRFALRVILRSNPPNLVRYSCEGGTGALFTNSLPSPKVSRKPGQSCRQRGDNHRAGEGEAAEPLRLSTTGSGGSTGNARRASVMDEIWVLSRFVDIENVNPIVFCGDGTIRRHLGGLGVGDQKGGW